MANERKDEKPRAMTPDEQALLANLVKILTNLKTPKQKIVAARSSAHVTLQSDLNKDEIKDVDGMIEDLKNNTRVNFGERVEALLEMWNRAYQFPTEGIEPKAVCYQQLKASYETFLNADKIRQEEEEKQLRAKIAKEEEEERKAKAMIAELNEKIIFEQYQKIFADYIPQNHQLEKFVFLNAIRNALDEPSRGMFYIKSNVDLKLQELKFQIIELETRSVIPELNDSNLTAEKKIKLVDTRAKELQDYINKNFKDAPSISRYYINAINNAANAYLEKLSKMEEERKSAEEAKKAEEERKKAEEAKKAQALKEAEEAKKAVEAKKAEEAKRAEEAKKNKEAREKILLNMPEKKNLRNVEILDELLLKRDKQKQKKLDVMNDKNKRMADEKEKAKKAEEAKRVEEEKKKAEEVKKAEEEKKKAEEAKRAEEARQEKIAEHEKIIKDTKRQTAQQQNVFREYRIVFNNVLNSDLSVGYSEKIKDLNECFKDVLYVLQSPTEKSDFTIQHGNNLKVVEQTREKQKQKRKQDARKNYDEIPQPNPETSNRSEAIERLNNAALKLMGFYDDKEKSVFSQEHSKNLVLINEAYKAAEEKIKIEKEKQEQDEKEKEEKRKTEATKKTEEEKKKVEEKKKTEEAKKAEEVLKAQKAEEAKVAQEKLDKDKTQDRVSLHNILKFNSDPLVLMREADIPESTLQVLEEDPDKYQGVVEKLKKQLIKESVEAEKILNEKLYQKLLVKFEDYRFREANLRASEKNFNDLFKDKISDEAVKSYNNIKPIYDARMSLLEAARSTDLRTILKHRNKAESTLDSYKQKLLNENDKESQGSLWAINKALDVLKGVLRTITFGKMFSVARTVRIEKTNKVIDVLHHKGPQGK